MLEILPSINCQTFSEVQENIKKVEPYVRWCHIDVTDGVFSTHQTWRNPADFINLKTHLGVEVHLMVENPEGVIDQWLVPPVKRVIVHLESAKNPEQIIGKCREKGVEIGFAIKPETSWEEFRPWFGKVDLMQVLCVHPGPSGQNVDWIRMNQKISSVKEECSDCIIEVDGGVNPDTLKAARDSGASIFVSGAYIFEANDIKEAIVNLQNV